MKFKPGDKVWIHVPAGSPGVLCGTLAGVILGRCSEADCRYAYLDYWLVDIPEHPTAADRPCHAHEGILSPRDDPPPQQERKREEVGSWDLCPWQPALELMWSELLSGKRGNRL